MITKQFGYGKGLRTGNKANDNILTPPHIAKAIISLFSLYGTVLDGFKGKGAFYVTIYPTACKKSGVRLAKAKTFSTTKIR